MQNLNELARRLQAPSSTPGQPSGLHQQQQQSEQGQLVKLVYGDAMKEAFGHIIDSNSEFIRFREQATGYIFNTPWNKVDTIVEIEVATPRSLVASQNR